METQIWPLSVAGWIGIFLSVVSVLGILYAWARNLVHLNGLGDRVNKVESDVGKLEARVGDFAIAVDRLIHHHTILTKEIADAEAAAKTYIERDITLRTDVLGYLADMKNEFNKITTDLREIVAGLKSDVAHLRGRRA